MQTDFLNEARRQAEICNACRYCEGYCSVFPALHRERAFSDGDLTQLANLCHNCRGCYYACQYTAPHEFDLNLPKALAVVRQDSWKEYAWPRGLAQLFDRNGVVIVAGLVLALSLIFALAQALRPEGGEGFYAYMSHGLMVAIFAPAFVVPLLALAVSLRSYWRTVGGGKIRMGDIWEAAKSAGQMRNLKGGHGDGCNFEDEDRFTHARRHLHQAVLYGFLLCFASTSSGTILHYGFGLEAPYGLLSLPKLLGILGGILLTLGCLGLAWIKTKADPNLGAPNAWGGEMAFVLLLGSVGFTGLILYSATGTSAVSWLLPLHLGTVLTFFLLTPFSKMAHGFYRMAALVKEAAVTRSAERS
ncbi:tricarballylate utilization 4Fe-4S protein TcuB [Loktanella sp. F6476L]|uniref:tricarballylate utilization 4Fe-4S protein TcuB n=1 Tax=Loktanella sp. F6476L TaxID=2926405 RepID=UPI001FF6E849|nr:tricarballylate utilization 4Fe-4S protein TcuB [Loktanella sp. F6476L]MCK0122656.1 tricarballylate utilization 4Fe-4S protein TcuB [Loktanella sp. F6476L]